MNPTSLGFRAETKIRTLQIHGGDAPKVRPALVFRSLVQTTLVMQQHLINQGRPLLQDDEDQPFGVEPLELLFDQMSDVLLEMQLQLDEAMFDLQNNDPAHASNLLNNLL